MSPIDFHFGIYENSIIIGLATSKEKNNPVRDVVVPSQNFDFQKPSHVNFDRQFCGKSTALMYVCMYVVYDW
jgi:hypothetical protein